MSEHQYLNLCKRIIEDGTDIYNERTGKTCRTVIGETFTYNVGTGEFPLVTTRKAPYKAAIAEMIGYLRGYNNANDFKALGTPTWLANANENEAWLANPYRNGDGDMGKAYRFREYEVLIPVQQVTNVGRVVCADIKNKQNPSKPEMHLVKVDQYKNIIDKLTQGIDDRRLIMSAHAPHFKDYACLDACMHTHHFSLIDGVLYLDSFQRSVDCPLGLVFNMVQVYFLLAITAQITGHKAGTARHHMVNCHIYDDQIELMKEQLSRTPYNSPMLKINENIKTLHDLETWVTMDDFELVNYKHHAPIKYPFAV